MYPPPASDASPAPAYIAARLSAAGWERVDRFTWQRPGSACRHSWPVADLIRRREAKGERVPVEAPTAQRKYVPRLETPSDQARRAGLSRWALVRRRRAVALTGHLAA